MTLAEQQTPELLTKLPPTAQAKLFDFAQFLIHKHGQAEFKLSAIDMLDEPLTEVSFQTVDEVRDYLNEERESRER